MSCRRHHPRDVSPKAQRVFVADRRRRRRRVRRTRLVSLPPMLLSTVSATELIVPRTAREASAKGNRDRHDDDHEKDVETSAGLTTIFRLVTTDAVVEVFVIFLETQRATRVAVVVQSTLVEEIVN